MLATLLKFAVLFALAPIWWPILKELYYEVEAALLEEGGLFGRPPTPEELAELRQKYADYRDPLISVPWANAREEIARQREEKRQKAAGRAGKRAGKPESRGASAPRRVSGGTLRGPSGRW